MQSDFEAAALKEAGQRLDHVLKQASEIHLKQKEAQKERQKERSFFGRLKRYLKDLF